MIPKVIHYCWFGNNEMTETATRCIQSWKSNCPDYEIKLWNEAVFDLESCPFVSEAYEAKRWAFVSDYARLKIIYENGGIYLDTDVELLKPLDTLLDQGCFLGSEKSGKRGYVNTGLGFGAEKGHYIIKKMMEEYEAIHFRDHSGLYNTLPCPRRNTRPLLRMGYSFSSDSVWHKDDIAVYPPEYFSPMDYDTGIEAITENSYSIHHYASSWKTDGDRTAERKIEQLDKNKIFPFYQIEKQWIQYKELETAGKPNFFIIYLLAKARIRLLGK